MENQNNSKESEKYATPRHIAEEKGNATPPLPTHISYGKGEKELLEYMLKLDKERFNIVAYSRYKQISRRTVRDRIDSLIRKGFVRKEFTGIYKITEIGRLSLSNNQDGGEVAGNSRLEWRGGANLSTHYTRYIGDRKDKQKFTKEQLKEKLSPIDVHNVELPNYTQWIVYYIDATVIINLKQISIRVQDIISNDTEQAHYENFVIATQYVNKLHKIGIIIDTLSMEPPHYARIKSRLADTLSKIDNRYYVDLPNGNKFWIDNSNDKLEDETNDETLRQNMDALVKYLGKEDCKLFDVDKMIMALNLITKIETIRTTREIRMIVSGEEPKEIKDKSLYSYFG